MSFQNSAAAETADGEHLFDRMGVGMAQHEIVTELFADLARRRGVRLVESEGYAEILDRGPQWFVVGVMPVVVIDDIGAQKDCPKAQLLDATARLSDRVVDAER